MLLLRHGGQFTDRRIERHLSSGYFYLLGGVVTIIVSSFYFSSIFGVIIGVVLTLGSTASFRRSGNWSAGKQGELAVTQALQSLPDQYVVLNDLVLPDGKGNVDHLVMGPNGLFVIETKNYSSYVRCLGDDWFVNGKKVHSLSKQAKRNAMAIKNSLAPIFAEHHVRMPFVTAVLVFVNRNGRLHISDPGVPVLRSSQLAHFISGYNGVKVPSIASARPETGHRPSSASAAAKARQTDREQLAC
jgi:Nuclease-related domain